MLVETKVFRPSTTQCVCERTEKRCDLILRCFLSNSKKKRGLIRNNQTIEKAGKKIFIIHSIENFVKAVKKLNSK